MNFAFSDGVMYETGHRIDSLKKVQRKTTLIIFVYKEGQVERM